MGHQAFWFDDAMAGDKTQPTALRGKHSSDVAIVGGGYTGLWTGIKLKLARPELRVTLVEKHLCGSGASGRNGGAMLTWSSKFPSLCRLYGLEEAIRLVKASEAGVGEIRDFCLSHGLDADIRADGTFYTATNPSQLGGMSSMLQSLNRHDINSWYRCSPEELKQKTGSEVHLEGHFSEAAGSLHPGKLVRGLRRIAIKLGVEIHELSSVNSIDYGSCNRLNFDEGELICKSLVLATNAWMPELVPELRRSIILVSSDMVITEPVPESLASIGLNHGAAVIDSRTFVHYYRSTPDGRLMLGKGGNTFSFGNRVRNFFDEPSVYSSQLSDKLAWMFPGIRLPLARSWTGASDRSVTGMPFFGRLTEHSNVFYGLGYSGNGVVQSYLGGDILSSLVLGLDNSWTRSGLVTGPRGLFPVEPFRYLGANLVRNAIRYQERRQDQDLSVPGVITAVANLAASAGKADH
ncbi:FAD-dependent oxidoreductase [Shewanella sp. YLB-07]|uniref:FAD-dependent oxidoreductase n=1 Tax=Shewanella sp. YLB-07 TaxID=2601268 RepID=UPI00128CFB27|nr:FAD-dependent oxidoreductase [Shewanella sp. YLB-07]MPY22610.1 FAD-dependent oxidoreductase [Shewanella sp. YLB-07]